MSLTFRELYDGPTTDTDGNAVRRFSVPAASEAAALAYTGDPGMPVVGQEHPRIPGLRCSRVSVGGRHGPAKWEVIATYSAPGTSFSFNPIDKGEPGSKWTEVSASFREIIIPYFVIRPISIPEYTGGAGPPALITRPNYEKPDVVLKYAVRQQTYRRVVNVDTLESGADFAIASKLNTIQTFPNGRNYLFTGFGITQDRTNSWQITYEWVYEPDTDLTDLLQPLSDASQYVILGTGAGGRRLLPQYHGFITGLAFVTNPPAPVIYTAPMYRADPNGWASFPGTPIP